MRLATWNVNGIRARQAQFLDWIARDRPDIVCLQEIKASPEQIPALLCEMEGYWCYWHGFRGYSGVGLHIRKDRFFEKPNCTHPSFDHETRIVTAALGRIVIASVYVPNGGKDYPAKLRFLESLAQFAGEQKTIGNDLILCGDINIARTDMDVHPKERKPNAIGQLPEERALFERIVANGLVDVVRAAFPNDSELFTWWPPWRNMKQRNIGWRIDYILASERIARSVTSCAVLREVGTSDHAPIIIDFTEEP